MNPQSASEPAYPPAFWGTAAALLVVQTGFGAILPLLPVFVRQRGFPLSDIGVMAAAYAAVAFVAQLGLGVWADRVGRKWLIVAGCLLEVVGTGGFLAHINPWWYIGFRVVQGLGSGAVVPAANALVADLVDESRRGRAYGIMAASSSAGFAVGPVLGGLAGAVWGLSAPFVVGVILNAGAAIMSAVSLPTHHSTPRNSSPRGDALWPMAFRLWPYFAVMFVWMGLAGMYDTSWSLYMRWLGAGPRVIGVSFTLFAGPLLIFNVWSGRIADRARRRHLVILGGLALQALTVCCYIFSRSVWLSIAIAVIEAFAISLTGPALSAAVMEGVPQRYNGAVQGLFQASGTLGSAVLALASGPLLVIRPNHPFILGSILLTLVTLAAAGWWRPWRMPQNAL